MRLTFAQKMKSCPHCSTANVIEGIVKGDGPATLLFPKNLTSLFPLSHAFQLQKNSSFLACADCGFVSTYLSAQDLRDYFKGVDEMLKYSESEECPLCHSSEGKSVYINSSSVRMSCATFFRPIDAQWFEFFLFPGIKLTANYFLCCVKCGVVCNTANIADLQKHLKKKANKAEEHNLP